MPNENDLLTQSEINQANSGKIRDYYSRQQQSDRAQTPLFDLWAWLCAVDGEVAFKAWKASFMKRNPQLAAIPDRLLQTCYSTDPDIRAYWQSPLGRLNAFIGLSFAKLRFSRWWPYLRYILRCYGYGGRHGNRKPKKTGG